MDSYQPIVVSQDPHNGDFTSIQQAIDSLPDNDQHYQIIIHPGVYRERILLARDNVHLTGYEQSETIITANCCNQKIQPDGRISGTYGSRTVGVEAKHCSLSYLTIKNEFNFLENQAIPERLRIQHTQSVALLIGNSADCVQCSHLILESYHDTLFVNGGKSYFHQCQILGAIDFIFGAGQAVFTQCDVVARNRSDIKNGQPYGYISAPSTHVSQLLGFVFLQCRLLKETGVPESSYALGRPWHPTAEFYDGNYADPNAIGHCAFVDCLMADHIYGWDKMSGKDKNGNQAWFYPHDSRFEEFNNFIINDQQQIVRKRAMTYSLPIKQYHQRLQQVQHSLSSWLHFSFQF
ncbi:pectinesterase family protein [Vibrio rumoiensis]|uniref:Pectinesterase n=1 Tax=Vibrio rumoiensis 1S-45 TaxID=1188252 RepID=A0A1E5E1N0_9VIBR|nr:pectinesterase family protein [Vibrio rumoiensis]OEF25207.1 hypothetical protein A1QC_09365 [Vibrio rumoiensis 1S-45]